MEKQSKKELKESYNKRTVIGGIYSIKCNGSGRSWVKSTKDLAGQENRFQFFTSTNTCPEPGMLPDWKQYGPEAFSFHIIEEIKKGDTQTDQEFMNDIRVLLELWKEKN